MVIAQALLAAPWLLVRAWSSGTGRVPIWVVPVGVAVIFATVSVPSSADESAYRFQARVFGAGQLAAVAPAGKTLVNNNHKNEFFLVNTIQSEGRWFGQYGPGWPVLLALPEKLGVGGYVNPLCAVLLLWITWRIAAHLDGVETARRALFFLVLSPMFLLNFSGYYSHGVTVALVAAATWLAISDRGGEWLKPLLVLASVVIVAATRPLSGLLCGLPLVAMLAWKRRARPSAVAGCVALAAAAAALSIGAQACYNYAQAGDPWRSLYAVYRGEVQLDRMLHYSPAELLSNLRLLGARSIVKTAASMFAFPMLIWSACSAVRARRPEYLLLAFLVVAFPLGYLIVAEQSDTVVGERYYLEGAFALAVLAAAGSKGPVPRWLVACSVLTAGAGTFWFSSAQQKRRAPFAAVEKLAARRTDPSEVVFLRAIPPSEFAPTDTNLNYPDWPQARPLFMPDPGLASRNVIVCMLGRKQWTVITSPERGVPADLSGPLTANCAP